MSGAGLEGAAPPLAVASALRYVPLTADQQLQLQHQDHQQQQQQQVAEGLLFVGSAVTNSQVGSDIELGLGQERSNCLIRWRGS